MAAEFAGVLHVSHAAHYVNSWHIPIWKSKSPPALYVLNVTQTPNLLVQTSDSVHAHVHTDHRGEHRWV